MGVLVCEMLGWDRGADRWMKEDGKGVLGRFKRKYGERRGGVCDDEKEMFLGGGDPNTPRKPEYLHYTPVLDDNLRAYILASSNFFLNLSTNSQLL